MTNATCSSHGKHVKRLDHGDGDLVCAACEKPVSVGPAVTSDRNAFGAHDFVTHVVPLLERVVEAARSHDCGAGIPGAGCSLCDAIAALDVVRSRE